MISVISWSTAGPWLATAAAASLSIASGGWLLARLWSRRARAHQVLAAAAPTSQLADAESRLARCEDRLFELDLRCGRLEKLAATARNSSLLTDREVADLLGCFLDLTEAARLPVLRHDASAARELPR